MAHRVTPPSREPDKWHPKPVVYVPVRVPLDLSDRVQRIIDRVNAERPDARKLVSRNSFFVAALADAVAETEKGLGLSG